MTRAQITQVLMLQATVLSLISHEESNKTINNFRRQIRKGLNHIYKHEKSFYETQANDANDTWNLAKADIDDPHYEITVSDMLHALNLLIENEKYTKRFYSQKSFARLYNSLTTRVEISDEQYIETAKSSNYLVDMFAKSLGIKRTKFSFKG